MDPRPNRTSDEDKNLILFILSLLDHGHEGQDDVIFATYSLMGMSMDSEHFLLPGWLLHNESPLSFLQKLPEVTGPTDGARDESSQHSVATPPQLGYEENQDGNGKKRGISTVDPTGPLEVDPPGKSDATLNARESVPAGPPRKFSTRDDTRKVRDRRPEPIVKDYEDLKDEGVVCGKGGNFKNRRKGDNDFLVHIDNLLDKNDFANMKPKDKTGLSKKLVEGVHSRGGKFKSRDAPTGSWYEVTIQTSRYKCSDALYKRFKQRSAAGLSQSMGPSTNLMEHRKTNEDTAQCD